MPKEVKRGMLFLPLKSSPKLYSLQERRGYTWREELPHAGPLLSLFVIHPCSRSTLHYQHPRRYIKEVKRSIKVMEVFPDLSS